MGIGHRVHATGALDDELQSLSGGTDPSLWLAAQRFRSPQNVALAEAATMLIRARVTFLDHRQDDRLKPGAGGVGFVGYCYDALSWAAGADDVEVDRLAAMRSQRLSSVERSVGLFESAQSVGIAKRCEQLEFLSHVFELGYDEEVLK